MEEVRRFIDNAETRVKSDKSSEEVSRNSRISAATGIETLLMVGTHSSVIHLWRAR